MKLNIIKKISGSRILWTNGEKSFFARGMRFFETDKNGQWQDQQGVLGSFIERMLSSPRLTRQFLRFGIHHIWPLKKGGILVIVRKRIYRVDPSGNAKLVLRFPRGNKPAHKGVCITPDGDIFLGEYALNGKRNLPVLVYRSCDGARSFEAIHEFKAGEVRHIHFVQWDPWEGCLWMGTGDADNECLLFKSNDRGDFWQLVGGGSQLWRAVGLIFRPEALYWGTDAGSDAGDHPNYIIRFDRSTGKLEKVLEVQGPCHGNATLQDGTLLVSTGVEGGINEKDQCAHLWASRDGKGWHELIKYKKDRWPFILQFGVIRLPQGLDSSNIVVFTCLGLDVDGGGEVTCLAKIVDS